MNSYNTVQIILKEASSLDVYGIRQCNKNCLPVYYPYGYYNQVIDSENNIVLLAKNNDTVIGYIIGELSSDYPDRFHIISFAVLKEYRKNKIGTNLMNKIIEVAKKRFINLNKISLYVMISNISAIKFYESLDFKKEKLLKNYYQSFNQDGLLYIKHLI